MKERLENISFIFNKSLSLVLFFVYIYGFVPVIQFCFSGYIIIWYIKIIPLQVNLFVEDGSKLGLMVRGGAEYGLGIYIAGVDDHSLADKAGLKVFKFYIFFNPSRRSEC